MRKKLMLIFVFWFFLLVTLVSGLNSNWAGDLPDYLSQYLSTNGLINGSKNANGDYTAGEEFYYQPSNNTVYRIARIIVTIGDTGITDADEYGALSARTNGSSFWIQENGVRSRLDGNVSITNNGQYVKLMYDFNCDLASLANGIDYCTGRWTFEKSGTLLRLNGTTGDRIIVMLNDSYVGLDEHYFLIQGYEELDTTTDNELLTDINEGFNMIGISILIVGFLAFIFYTANKITDRDDKGNLVPTYNLLKTILIVIGGFTSFMLILLSVGFADAAGLAGQITGPLNTFYMFLFWIYVIFGFIFLVGLIANVTWSLMSWLKTVIK